MENYNFVGFKSTGSRFNLAISIGKAERFYFSNSFCTKYNVLSMAGVMLFYDKTKKAVGFKFVKEPEDGMLDIMKMSDKSAYLNGKAFMGINDIDPEKYIGRYKPIEIENGDQKIFVIELKEEGKESV